MKKVIVIPARYKSTRFPGKPLTPLLDKPLVVWVAELSARVLGHDNVYIATDDKRIGDVVKSHGFQSVFTSEHALTGTDRLAEAAEQIRADIFINVQGDEPLIDPDDINRFIHKKIQNMNHVINGFCWISGQEDPDNVNIPKVITNENGRLVYMSRKALPGHNKDKNAPSGYKKQVCVYAFTKKELQAFRNFGRKSELESCEDIEILRFLELDIPILMIETSGGSLAVDVPEDVSPAEQALKRVHGL